MYLVTMFAENKMCLPATSSRAGKKRSLWQTNCFELNVFFVFRARHKIAFNLFTLNFLSFHPFSAKVPFCGRLPSGLSQKFGFQFAVVGRHPATSQAQTFNLMSFKRSIGVFVRVDRRIQWKCSENSRLLNPGETSQIFKVINDAHVWIDQCTKKLSC